MLGTTLLHGEFCTPKCANADETPSQEVIFCEKVKVSDSHVFLLTNSMEGGAEVDNFYCIEAESREDPGEDGAELDLAKANDPGSGLHRVSQQENMRVGNLNLL